MTSRSVNVTRAALLLFLALGVVGCFEVREEIWVREDGTVRYALDYGIPEFMFVGMTEVDGGSADSVLSHMRPPARAVVEGDSVWNRDYLDRDLRHFVSERQLGSLDRLVALAGREAARADSMTREAAQRESTLRVLTKRGPLPSAVRDSVMRAAVAQDSSRRAAAGRNSQGSPMGQTMGQVLGGYETLSAGPHRIKLTHIVFPKPTRSQLQESYGNEMERTPSPGQNPDQARRMLAGRTYTYRLHAAHIVSANGTLTEDGRSVEWSFPMASIVGDSMRTLEAVIELKKGK